MIFSQIITVGINDCNALEEGWYGLEKSPEGLVYRASAREALLKVPFSRQRVHVTLLLSARPEHTGEVLKGIVSASAGADFTFELAANTWTVRRGSLDIGEDRMIRILVYNPWSPDTLYKNGDSRSLGILLSAVHVFREE